MNGHYLRLVIWLPVLIFVQLVALNHLRIFEYFLPVLYLYPLLKMPYDTGRWTLILIAAVTGFIMDLLMNTPGLNMAATVLTMYCRKPLLTAMIPDDVLDDWDGDIVPGTKTMKVFPYLLYLFILTLAHVSVLLILEGFSLGLFRLILPYILGGTVFSFVLYLLFDLFSFKKEA